MPNRMNESGPPVAVQHKRLSIGRVLEQFHTTQYTLKKIHPATVISAQELDTQAQITLREVEELLADLKLQYTGGWTGSVSDVKALLTKTVGLSPDITMREIAIGRTLRWPALACFASGLVDNQMVDQDIIRRLENYLPAGAASTSSTPSIADLANSITCVSNVKASSQWEDSLIEMLSGTTVLFVEGMSEIMLLDTAKYPQRAIGQSSAEPSVKGPQEAFSDIGLVQISQLRRRLATPDLRFDSVTIGGYSHTKVQLAYIRGLTNPKMVDVIRLRLATINRDWVQIGQQVAAGITNRRFTPFPVVRLTDRVDIVARDLMQGKVAVLVANDPFAVTYPNRLIDFYQTTQDYVFNFWEGTLVRLLRLVGTLAGLYTMPFYIALTSVDPDLMPTRLVLTLTGSRIGVPFPPRH